MIGPLMDLLITVALLALAGAIFWPESGWFWRWRAMARTSERVRIEDALKHLHEVEYRNQHGSLDSVAGALGLSSRDATDLVARIEALGFAHRSEGHLELTPDGSDYARRIIRTHRLWERHLAEETGLPEVDWHGEAEHQEHKLTPEEVEELAARMGHPRFDPHGDPIPTPSGELPPWEGRPLPSLPVGELGTIVHVEDEPREIYAQLVAENLHPGMRVQMLEVAAERVRFWADGDEHILAPVVAANLSFVALPQEQEMQGPFETLAALEPGESARVLQFAPSCRGLQRRRLMDLGLLPGTDIEAEMTSAGGDPTAYRVRGSLVALRSDQARHIHITRPGEAA
ncbi:MAG: DtxR family transcriptional regulator [Gemmatimonadetes bacterium]|nr:DtxR family transcriptional regulator [Gemmatimonadota bacterium]